MKQTFGPKQAIIDEKMNHFFLGPNKIVIRNECRNSGFMYSSSFYPVMITVLEEDPVKRCVSFKVYFKVHFIKNIPFIGGKIEREGKKEATANLTDVFIPLIHQTLESGARAGSVSPRASEIPVAKTRFASALFQS